MKVTAGDIRGGLAVLALLNDPESAAAALKEIAEASETLEKKRAEVDRMQVDANAALEEARKLQEAAAKTKAEAEKMIANWKLRMEPREREMEAREKEVQARAKALEDAELGVRHQRMAADLVKAEVEKLRTDTAVLYDKMQKDNLAAQRARANAETDAQVTAMARAEAEKRLSRIRAASEAA